MAGLIVSCAVFGCPWEISFLGLGNTEVISGEEGRCMRELGGVEGGEVWLGCLV